MTGGSAEKQLPEKEAHLWLPFQRAWCDGV